MELILVDVVNVLVEMVVADFKVGILCNGIFVVNLVCV